MTAEGHPVQTQPLIVAAGGAGIAREVFVWDAATAAEVRQFGMTGNVPVIAGRAATRALIGHGSEVQDALTGEITLRASTRTPRAHICAIGGVELPIAVEIGGQWVIAYDALTGDTLGEFRNEALEGDERGPDYSTSVIREPHMAVVGGPPGRERVVVGYRNEGQGTTSLLAWKAKRPVEGWLNRLRRALRDDVPYEVVSTASCHTRYPSRERLDLLAVGEGIVAAAISAEGTVEIAGRLPQERHFQELLTLNDVRLDAVSRQQPVRGVWGSAYAIAVGNIGGGREAVAASWQHRLGVYVVERAGLNSVANPILAFTHGQEEETGQSLGATQLAIGRVKGRDSLVAGYPDGAIRAWDISTKEKILDMRPATGPITTLAVV